MPPCIAVSALQLIGKLLLGEWCQAATLTLPTSALQLLANPSPLACLQNVSSVILTKSVLQAGLRLHQRILLAAPPQLTTSALQLVGNLHGGHAVKDVACFTLSMSALQLMGNLDWGRAVEEIGAAAQYLRDQGAKKVGVQGDG